MNDKPKPIVGQVLYELNVGNAARHRKQELIPVIVTKVGRKYFTCERTEGWARPTEYHLKNWGQKTEYVADSRLYADPRAWEDEKEFTRIKDKLREFFNRGRLGVSLDALKAVESIIDPI